MVKNSNTGITNAREYQMLWRHLAYRTSLVEKLGDEEVEPLVSLLPFFNFCLYVYVWLVCACRMLNMFALPVSVLNISCMCKHDPWACI